MPEGIKRRDRFMDGSVILYTTLPGGSQRGLDKGMTLGDHQHAPKPYPTVPVPGGARNSGSLHCMIIICYYMLRGSSQQHSSYKVRRLHSITSHAWFTHAST